MNNYKFIYAFAILMPLISCKERATTGVNLSNFETIRDTTYVAAVETKSEKKVLIEEFTGASCPHCPNSRTMLENINTQKNNKLVILELHPHFGQGLPIAGVSKYDFTNQWVEDNRTIFYPSIPALPCAGINRILFNSSFAGNARIISKDYWSDIINDEVNKKSSVNMQILNNSYNDTKREGVFNLKIAYTDEVKAKQYVTIAIVEDNIIDAQEMADRTINYEYNFKNVLRKIITPAGGLEILKDITVKTPGRVYEGGYKYVINPEWHSPNCRLVAFIHNNDPDDKEVLQAISIEVNK